MAVRPDSHLKETTIVSKTVKSGVTVSKGVGVKVASTGELEVDVAGANEKAYGVAMDTVIGDGILTVDVALLDGGVIPVKASGTATAGEFAICGTDGFENVTLGGGTVVKYVAGVFTQTGVDGDFVGLQAGKFAGVSA
jgi:hypothetical protein